MKTLSIAVLSAGAILLMASCGNSGKQKDNEITFTSYNFDMMSELTDPDSIGGREGSLCRVVGEGVLPVGVGENDISTLRDSLENMGKVIFTEKGEASPRYGHELRPASAEEATSEAGNYVSNTLTLTLLTSRLAVWQDYVELYAYGAAHGRSQTSFLNYDIKNNRIISLRDLLKPDYEKELIPMLEEKVKENPEVFRDAEIDIPSNFRITSRGGLTFLYPVYDIAPFSAGEISVSFSAYELGEMLSPLGEDLLLGGEW